MAEPLLDRLHKFCETNDIRRLAAEEIAELLADGEDPEWVAGQAAGERPEVAESLTCLLAELAPGLRPTSAVGDEAGQAAGDVEAAAPTQIDGGVPDDWEEQLAALAQALPAGVDAGQLRQAMASPRGRLLADFGAYCQEQGLTGPDADEERLRQLHDVWLQTPRSSLEGRRPADLLEGGRLLPERVETFRREQPKVGRNDPCPCGSGRKFKKCCGRDSR